MTEGVMPPSRGAVAVPLHIDPRARFEILGAILLAMFLSALDQTIVGTALPRIVSELHGNDLYTWVVTVYLLTATVSGPIYGKLSDLFGRRPMIMIGVGLFLIGSALSGLSQEMWQLVAARGLQGLGAGAIFPIALAVIGDLFTPAERGKYQGLFGAVFGVSALIGPALGGLLTDNFSWHWVFFVNLPIGLIAMAIIWRLLPPVKHPESVRSIDYLGSAVFTAAIVPILIGLTNKQKLDWTDPVVGGLILVGTAFLALFIWIESRAQEPIVPLSLFRNRSFTVSVIAVLLASFGFFGAIIFVPRWFQVVLGSSATESGYQMLPLLVGLIAQLGHLRPGDQPDRPLSLDRDRVDGHPGARSLPDDQPASGDEPAPDLALDGGGRRRDRTHARGVHDHRPECRPVLAARDRDEHAHLLPAGRRHHRPGARGHALWVGVALGDSAPAREQGRAAADHRSLRRVRQHGGRALGWKGSRRADPCAGAPGLSVAAGAADASHRVRDP